MLCTHGDTQKYFFFVFCTAAWTTISSQSSPPPQQPIRKDNNNTVITTTTTTTTTTNNNNSHLVCRRSRNSVDSNSSRQSYFLHPFIHSSFHSTPNAKGIHIPTTLVPSLTSGSTFSREVFYFDVVEERVEGSNSRLGRRVGNNHINTFTTDCAGITYVCSRLPLFSNGIHLFSVDVQFPISPFRLEPIDESASLLPFASWELPICIAMGSPFYQSPLACASSSPSPPPTLQPQCCLLYASFVTINTMY